MPHTLDRPNPGPRPNVQHLLGVFADGRKVELPAEHLDHGVLHVLALLPAHTVSDWPPHTSPWKDATHSTSSFGKLYRPSRNR